VIGGVAIVLAAMYALRLISAVLHRKRGGLVTDAALDLRPAELCVIVPLVACLLALSAWPAAISGHSFPKAATATSGWTSYGPSTTGMGGIGLGPISSVPSNCKVTRGPNGFSITCSAIAGAMTP
jgi:hypothetical protein